MPVREDFPQDDAETQVAAYQARIETHIAEVKDAVAEYLQLRGEEQQLRRTLKLPGLTMEEHASLQNEQNEIGQKMRDLALRFFNWGFTADDLRTVQTLDANQITTLALDRLAVTGLRDLPLLPESRSLFQKALDDYRKGVLHTAVLAGRRLPVQDAVPPLPPQPVGTDFPAQSASILPRVRARMQVEMDVARTLADYQQRLFSGCIPETWRIWSVPLGRAVLRVELEHSDEGVPLNFRCYYYPAAGQETSLETKTAAPAELNLILTRLVGE